jgi:5-methylcytosine-specific restriction endonuclease McrA
MSPALVLNATFEPIAVVASRRAILLVLADKADIVEAGDDEWRSATAAIRVPLVVKLRRYVRIPYRTTIPLTGRNLMARDGHVCAYCPKRASTIDHVHPRSRGGQHRWENVVAACAGCNQKKGDRTLKELGWKLTRRPFAPTGRAWLMIGVADRDPSWEPYLTGAGLAPAGV